MHFCFKFRIFLIASNFYAIFVATVTVATIRIFALSHYVKSRGMRERINKMRKKVS